MMNQRNIENVRRKLHLSSLTETKLFESIDRDGKGYISSTDLEVWLRLRNSGGNQTRFERAFRRMDLNNDGRITFEEFLQMVRPVYNYSSSPKTLDVSKSRIEPIYTSPPRSRRDVVNSMKEEQINQKLAEIDVLRHEIHESKLIDEKERSLYRTPRESDAHIPSMVSTIKRSIYDSKYRSPARRIAAEVREEILARSMDRARMRALYGSPLREYYYMYPRRIDVELEESRR